MTALSAKTARIFVAGHRGLAGSAILRLLSAQGYSNLIVRSRSELDLTDQLSTRAFFAKEKPDYVVLAAAKVGGIFANDAYPAEFIHQNLLIQTNVIHESWKVAVKRLVFLGSSCIYPRDCPQPIREEYLLTGPLEATNQAYALAKIAGIEMCAAYNRQYGTQYLCVMPTNLYGIGDNYNLSTAHVLPALIRKAHTARVNQDVSMIAWGTGLPRRELLCSDDLASACLLLLEQPWPNLRAAFPTERLPLINIGSGTDVSIKALTRLVCETIGFHGSVVWDHTKPDGTPRKLLEVSRMAAFGWQPKVSLEVGIRRAYDDFLATFAATELTGR